MKQSEVKSLKTLETEERQRAAFLLAKSRMRLASHVFATPGVEPYSSRKAGYLESLLPTARVDQSVNEAALQSRADVLQGVRLMIQHRCQFSQDPSVTHPSY